MLRQVPVERKKALQAVHPNCADIDVGQREHYVAVDERADERPVRRFGSSTDEVEIGELIRRLRGAALEKTWKLRRDHVRLARSRKRRRKIGEKPASRLLWDVGAYGDGLRLGRFVVFGALPINYQIGGDKQRQYCQ